IQGAKEIEITLNNNKTFDAQVIGTHPNSDIALVKIEATDLPFITFANSDNVKVGEWVLAVGNPFNLTSTVTAGIVSAKARDINISQRGNKIESFIQTDAAVNPGNSGGALVNTRGELVGINTAISSQTGSYVGYSFAVPSNIAKKVIEDLIEFGDVQTAYLGIRPLEINSESAKELELLETEGVLISSFSANSRAKKAGLKENDIIVKLDDITITKYANLEGFLTTKRPGDEIDVTVLRDREEFTYKVKLGNQFGNEKFKKLDFSENIIGDLKKISSENSEKFKINFGVEIKKLRNDYLQAKKVKTGDLILRVGNEKVYSAQEVENLLRKNKGKNVSLQILFQEGYADYVRVRVQE
ncbi:UNVERIFIED_CONTAM: hypothetical protein GTU68_057573, partial [Idotea baltica]|nr:hypothetical protein [Idotea baltica]